MKPHLFIFNFSGMRRFLLNLLFFIPFSMFFYIVMIVLWGSFSHGALQPNLNTKLGAYGHTFTRLSDVKHNENLDVLFLGSSHAYRGFDPRIFKKYGLRTFNLGSSAQSPLQTKVLLKRYLSKLHPKIVVYEVYPSALQSDGVESGLDIIANDQNDIHSLFMTLEINHVKAYNAFIYSVVRQYLGSGESFAEPKVIGKDTYIDGGYVESELEHFSTQKFNSVSIELEKRMFFEFESVLQMLKSENCKVILVFAPIAPGKYESYENVNQFDSLMLSYGDYYNFNKLVNVEDSLHFKDSHHLNQLGVKAFNEVFVNDLCRAFKPGLGCNVSKNSKE